MHVCVHSYHGYDQITDTNCIGSYIHWYPGAGACDKRFFLLVGELCTVQSCRNANQVFVWGEPEAMSYSARAGPVAGVQ